MRTINFHAKAEHFAELASRAAYAAATAIDAATREQWEARAASYDERAENCRRAARVAA